MKSSKLFESIHLSVIPYSSTFLCSLADEYSESGADGIAVVCGDRFPWNNNSRNRAGEYYAEQEIAALISHCRKKGITCRPVFFQSDLDSILFSLKGYEKYCNMSKEDMTPFYYKLFPEFFEDIMGLFSESPELFIYVDDSIDSGRLLPDGSVKLIPLTETKAGVQYSGGGYTLNCCNCPGNRESNYYIFPSLPDGGLFRNTVKKEREYRKIVQTFNVIGDRIFVADIHTRTGSAYPLSFWKEMFAAAEEYGMLISTAITKLKKSFTPYVGECWLERWMYSENIRFKEKSDRLKEICRQHIYIFTAEA